jgi:hydrogenase maturation protein HypF
MTPSAGTARRTLHGAARDIETRSITVAGHVQGVGFRPFVYRLAIGHGLTGWVQNRVGEVRILLQGSSAAIAAFKQELTSRAPALAHFSITADEPTAYEGLATFSILASDAHSAARIFVPADQATCAQCRAELSDPHNRRYRYPFINCTNCGPRYTLIDAMPYDRANTSMARFVLCDACAREYRDPPDRRFHAEPLACPVCGPSLTYHVPGATTMHGDAALRTAVTMLEHGGVVAVKGIGGYHLICDAGNETSVAALRLRKRRPAKPLAVMFPLTGRDGLDAVRSAVELNAAAQRLLRSSARPIVLAKQRPTGLLASGIAPGLEEIGVLLPYSPLHELLTSDFGKPLVATSGNLSGEPILTDELEAEQRLAGVVDAFLHHDRPISRPADDPVFRDIGGAYRPLRLGRGCAPTELTLPYRLEEPILALGGHLKNTVTLAWQQRAVVSSHLGNLDAPRSLAVFERAVADLQALYGVDARALVCDAHPRYATTRWAAESGLETLRIGHHVAHASALAGEHALTTPMLVFAWDGVGLGEDGTLWGGETLLGHPGHWRRVASIVPFRLPGGDRAAREPWRSAISVCWQTGRDWAGAPDDKGLLRQAWERGINSPPTSAIGRLFDAAAALVLGVEATSYEGEAPMRLEAAANDSRDHVELPLRADHDGLDRLDWSPLVGALLEPGRDVGERAALVHESLAQAILTQARRIRARRGIDAIGCTGGVFQNKRLGERAQTLLEQHGFRVYLSERVPCNDGGLSFGQAVEVAARRAQIAQPTT